MEKIGGPILAWGKIAPIVAFVVIYPLDQILRARKEAQVLEKTFGDGYRRYRAKTWM